MSILNSPLKEWSSYEDIKLHMENGSGAVQLSGCIDAAKAYLIQGLSSKKTKLIVTFNEQRAKELLEDFKVFEKNVFYYPAKDVLFYQADIRGNILTSQRLSTLKAMQENPDCTVITTFDALMDRLIPFEELQNGIKEFKVGNTISLNDITKELISMGYERRFQVEAVGEFALRGGILDIFPLSEDAPIRIELWDDEIDSIRSFDVESQRSIEQLSSVLVYPATEVILDEERIERGLGLIEKEAKELYEKFRGEFKTEESFRLKSMVEELREGLETRTNLIQAESFLTYFDDRNMNIL